MKVHLWAVESHEGKILAYTARTTRKNAIQALVGQNRKQWRRLREGGFKAIKVTLEKAA